MTLLIQARSGWQQSLAWRSTSAHDVVRVFGCHFTHFSSSHLAWDLGAFVLLGLACELLNPWRFVFTCVAAAGLIPLLLHWLAPWLTTYRGLSGVDSALFGLLLATGLSDCAARRHRLGFVLIGAAGIGFVLQNVIELRYGVTLWVDSTSNTGGFLPVPTAHIVGFILGAGIQLIGAFATAADRMRHHDPDCCRNDNSHE